MRKGHRWAGVERYHGGLGGIRTEGKEYGIEDLIGDDNMCY